jgi:quinol monooxygenase YgiN
MIHVVVALKAFAGKRQALLDEINLRLETVRAEEGCVEYTVAIDASEVGSMQRNEFGEDTIVLLEKWSSLEHLEAHGKAPYIPEYYAIIGPMIEGRTGYFLTPAL